MGTRDERNKKKISKYLRHMENMTGSVKIKRKETLNLWFSVILYPFVIL